MTNTLHVAEDMTAVAMVDGEPCAVSSGDGVFCLSASNEWQELAQTSLISWNTLTLPTAAVMNGTLYLGAPRGLLMYTGGSTGGWPLAASEGVTEVNGTLWGATADGLGYLGAPLPPVAVTAVTPTSGPASGGTSVTMSGTGFSDAQTVLFGSTPAPTFTVDSDSEITAQAPPGMGTVDITVTTLGGPPFVSPTTTADQFTYTACGSAAVNGSAVSISSCDGKVTLNIPQGAMTQGTATLTEESLQTLAQSANAPTASTGDQALMAELKQAAQAGTLSISVGGQTIPCRRPSRSPRSCSSTKASPKPYGRRRASLRVWPSRSARRKPHSLDRCSTSPPEAAPPRVSRTSKAPPTGSPQNVAYPPSAADPQGGLAGLENGDRNAFLFGTPPQYASSGDPRSGRNRHRQRLTARPDRPRGDRGQWHRNPEHASRRRWPEWDGHGQGVRR